MTTNTATHKFITKVDYMGWIYAYNKNTVYTLHNRAMYKITLDDGLNYVSRTTLGSVNSNYARDYYGLVSYNEKWANLKLYAYTFTSNVNLVVNLATGTYVKLAYTSSMTNLAFISDDRFVTIQTNGTIDVYSCNDGSKLKSFTSDVVKNLNFSQYGDYEFKNVLCSFGDDVFMRNKSAVTYHLRFNIEDETVELISSSTNFINIASPQNTVCVGSNVASYVYGSCMIYDGSYKSVSVIYLNETERNITGFNRDGINYYKTGLSTGGASDVLNGKTVYISSGKVTGTMPNNGALSYTPSTEAQTIPAGYTSGGTIAAVSITDEGYNNALELSEQILNGEGGEE